jgi:benzylsuccinate CoA-transferase BbsE subunit
MTVTNIVSEPRGQASHLSDIVAVELGEGLAGAYCGRWLRLNGATVIKIEDSTTGGDRLRHEDLTPDGWRRSTRRSMFAALHSGKQSVMLDYSSDAGQKELSKQVARAHVVVSSFTRDEMLENGLTEVLLDPSGERITVSCTPFGLDGPYADYRATDEILLCYGGSMCTLGQSKGPPRHIRVPMADFVGGVFGFTSALLGLLNPAAGRVFDVSVTDSLAANLERVTMFFSHLGLVHLRGHGMHRHFAGHPGGLYPCKDGYVMVAMAGSPIQMMALLVEQPELEEHLLFKDRLERHRRPDEFDALILPWFLEHTAEEIVTKAHELRMPFSYVLRPSELLNDPQLGYRQSLVELNFPDHDHPIRMPGLPYRYRELDAKGAPNEPLEVPS